MEFLLAIRKSLISNISIDPKQTKNWDHLAQKVNLDTNAHITATTCYLLWQALKKEALQNVNDEELHRLAKRPKPKLEDLYNHQIYKTEWDIHDSMAFHVPGETIKQFKLLIQDLESDNVVSSSSDGTSASLQYVNENLGRTLAHRLKDSRIRNVPDSKGTTTP